MKYILFTETLLIYKEQYYYMTYTLNINESVNPFNKKIKQISTNFYFT